MARPVAWALLAVLVTGTPVPAAREGPGAGGGSPVRVVVGARALGPAVPGDFLGLSFEAASLAQGLFAPHHRVLERLLAGLGHGVIRFGGATLDRTAWAPSGTFPGAVAVLTPRALAQMFAFARRAGWRVILGLNLGHFDPRAAADEAAVAWRLAGGTLAAFEFGNEPDLYTSPFTGPLRPQSYGAQGFVEEWQAYLHRVRREVPHAPVAGPSVAGVPGGVEMLRQLVEAERDDLQLATSHHYPLGAPITDPSSPAYASIPNLLSPSLRERETEELGGWARIALDSGLALRLTETNSVFGGGKHGVSDTLAGALWTVDYLFRVAELGIVGVNLHATLDRCGGYTPICAPSPAEARADRFRVQPNYYALLLFHVAARGRFVPTHVAPEAPVTAYATRDATGVVRVTLVAMAPHPVTVRLRLLDRRDSGAVLRRLEGPSVGATRGVTFGGRQVSPDGGWSGDAGEPVQVRGGRVDLTLPPWSVTVLTFSP